MRLAMRMICGFTVSLLGLSFVWVRSALQDVNNSKQDTSMISRIESFAWEHKRFPNDMHELVRFARKLEGASAQQEQTMVRDLCGKYSFSRVGILDVTRGGEDFVILVDGDVRRQAFMNKMLSRSLRTMPIYKSSVRSVNGGQE